MQEVRRYLTDDRDEEHRNELIIFQGGNGDWYVAVVPEGERSIGRSVRICTSGGASSACPGLPSAIAAAYRAMSGSQDISGMYRFVTRFYIAHRISACDCCDFIDVSEIEAEVFSRDEASAKEFLLSWLPPCRVNPKNIVFSSKETSTSLRNGVLFLSRKHIYRGESDKVPEHIRI